MTTIPADDPTTRLFLRHTPATLADRAGEPRRGTPPAVGDDRASADPLRGVRSSVNRPEHV